MRASGSASSLAVRPDYASVDGHELPKVVVPADDGPGLLAFELQVLGQLTDHTAREEDAALLHLKLKNVLLGTVASDVRGEVAPCG